MISRAVLFAPAILAAMAAGCSRSNPDVIPAPAPSAPQSAGAQDAAPGFVRGVYLVAGGAPAKLQIGDKIVGELAKFGSTSRFVAVAPGDSIKIAALAASGAEIAKPTSVKLASGDHLTVVINGVAGKVELLPFNNKSGDPQPGKSKMAFINAAKDLPAVEAGAGGKMFGRNIAYGKGVDYLTLDPGVHWIMASYARASGTKPRTSLDYVARLKPAESYVLMLFRDESQAPKLRALRGRFADTLQAAPKSD